MVTRDDIVHEQRIPNGLTVTITEIDENPREPRDIELTAVDSNGKKLKIVLWKTHDLEYDWSEGATYELSGGRGKVYDSNVQIHSQDSFRAERVDTNDDATRFLVVGDTHVGYRHRSEKPSWARNVDNRETFKRCIERAQRLDVEAIIHAGDVFDHENTVADRKTIKSEISRAHESGVPFYYVFGNHDDQRGRRLLRGTPASRLTDKNVHVDDPAVNLLGVDYAGKEFPKTPPDASIEMLFNPNILVIHETPYPVVNQAGNLVYKKNGADLAPFFDSLSYGIDLIISGHMHVAEKARLKGFDIPVLVTGPTSTISKYEKENCPSTWLVTISDDGTHIERHPL